VNFTNVNANDITDRLNIRIVSVNGVPAETAARNGVIQIKAVPKAEYDRDSSYQFVLDEIRRYDGSNPVIPNVIWGEPVVAIGERAFANNNFTNVVIPDSVTIIRDNAFANNQLTSITIGSGVRISKNSFPYNFSDAYRYGAGTYTYKHYASTNEWIPPDTEYSAEVRKQENKQKAREFGQKVLVYIAIGAVIAGLILLQPSE